MTNITLSKLLTLLDIPTFDELYEDALRSTWTYTEAFQDAKNNGCSNEEAWVAAEEAEAQESKEYYDKWKSAAEYAANYYTELHGMNLTYHSENDTVDIVENRCWRAVADKIKETINGVGIFYYSSVEEFKDSIPAQSYEETAVSHLHWIKRYGDVFGEASPKQMFEHRLR